MKNALGFMVAAASFAISTGAVAQESVVADCNAVLRNGTFSYSEYRNNSYYMQIVYSRFLSSTYESSMSDTSLGMGIPLGEAVMGSLNYTREQYEARKRMIDDTRFSRIESRNEMSTILLSGDARILDAWNTCIREGGGGLSVHFERLSATQVSLIIEYKLQGTQNFARLNANVVLPGVDRSQISNPECLQRGRRIYAGSPCRTTVTLASAWATLPVNVNTDQGSAGAYLAPRIKLVEERQAFPVPSIYQEFFRRGNVKTEAKVSLSAEDSAARWVLDPASARGSVEVVFNNGSMNWCASPYTTVGATTMDYGFYSMSHTHGHSGWTIGCRMSASVDKVRNVWVADEAAPPTKQAPDYQPSVRETPGLTITQVG